MNEPDRHKSRTTESFYGRRKGPQLRGRKLRLMEELLPQLRLDTERPSPRSIEALFENSFKNTPENSSSRRANRYQLEVGFGGGEHLAHQAIHNPQTAYIGIEPFVNGMAKMLGMVEDHQLKNIRLYDDDATQLLDWLPANSLDQIDLLYPDPWPKKRHWKRRFINPKNLARFARVLKPGSTFRFASDIDTYINWTLAHVNRQGDFDWQAEKPDDWHTPWPGWVRTRYEAKAIREGRTPCYLEFQTKS